MRQWWLKLRAMLTGRRGLSAGLREEMDAHLAMQIEDGQLASDARRRFGNRTLIEESVRDAWSFAWFETLLRDLRYGLRGILRSPGFALVIVLTLGLGIGANTAIFSVVDSVLLKPLPYPDADRLVWLAESDPKAPGISVTWGNYLEWRRSNHSFEKMAGFEMNRLTLTGHGQPSYTAVGFVTSEFFDLVGVKPLIGQVFSVDDDRAGAAPTAVLAHDFWLAKFGGDTNVLGQELDLNGKAYRIAGVLPAGLNFFGRPADCYLPLGAFRSDAAPRAQHGRMRLLARLKAGVSLASARADLDRIMEHLAQSDPGPENDHRAYMRLLSRMSTRDVRPMLYVLLGAVGLVLLIACANVASLLMARSATRVREMAIRTAIGAGRSRLVRQLLTENLLIAVAGGAFGLLLAQWGVRGLLAVAPRGIPRLNETTIDWPVLLFTAGLTILTGLLVGFAPAWTASRIELTDALNSSGRSSTGSKRDLKFRNAIVVAEIAVTLVLAFGSALLLRSLMKAQNSNPGFAPDRLLALELALPSSTYRGEPAIRNFYERLESELRGLPGVQSAGAVNCAPSTGDCSDWFYSILGGSPPAQGDVPLAVYNVADPAYFASMGIPLREGRAFTEGDREGAPLVAIVNETLARRWWPHETAVGHQIKEGGPYTKGRTFEIVGVAGDLSQDGLDTEPRPEIYMPLGQNAWAAMALMIRSTGDPNLLAPAVRRVVASMDANLPIVNLQPFESRIAASLDRRRFGTLLLGVFAGLALLLSAVGMYGLLNYWVTAREEEIAIRLALGARRSTILRWAGLQASRLVAAGVALGLAAGWAASHWLQTLVFGISPRDSRMMILAALAMVVLAALATAAPLARASKVDAARKLQRA